MWKSQVKKYRSSLAAGESIFIACTNHQDIVKPVLRGHLWDKEKVVFQDRWPFKRDSVHMKISMTGQEKGDLSIQVTA
jgi:hypothetical protein